MLEKLMNNPIAWLVLSLITVISFVFAIYTWITGKRRKEVSVSDISHVILKAGKSQIEKLDVRYNGVNIDNLTSTKFYIWNSGNDVINSSDVVESKNFTIYSCDDTTILDAQIVNETDPSNKFRVAQVENNMVRIDFDYIDQGEGCLVQLLHTGSAEVLLFGCKIKGGKKVRYCYEDGKKTVPVTSNLITAFGAALEALPVASLLPAGILATAVSRALELNEEYWADILLMLLIMIAITIAFFLLFKLLLKKYNKTFHREVPATLKGSKKR